MKRIFLAVVVLVATFLAAYAVWVQFPRLHQPESVASTLQQASERFDQLSRMAADPAKNGFETAIFLPYWGRRSTEYKENSPIESVVKDWAQYSGLSSGQPIDHKALRASQNAKYLKALNDFEKVSPELLAAWGKPVFLPPGTTMSFDTELWNFQATRTCAQALVALAEAKAAQGQSDQAANILARVMEFGGNLQGQGALLIDVVGMSTQRSGIDGFLPLMQPAVTHRGTPLPAGRWKDLAGRLTKAVPPADTVYRAMQGETAVAVNTIDQIRQGKSANSLAAGPTAMPGLLDREERIYLNLMMDMLGKLKDTGKLVTPAALDRPTAGDHLAGRSGLLAEQLLPNFSRASYEIEMNRRRILALALCAGVAAYRADNGKLPDTLDDVRKFGIPMPAVDDLEGLKPSYSQKVFKGAGVGSGQSATLIVDLPAEPGPSPGDAKPQETGNDWFLTEKDKIVVTLFAPQRKL
jgi:hypothetical protein